jgi:hypothetical protein
MPFTQIIELRTARSPRPRDVAAKLAALVDGAPAFSNLDVVEEVEL